MRPFSIILAVIVLSSCKESNPGEGPNRQDASRAKVVTLDPTRLTVDGNPDVYTFESKPYEGIGHGDGTAPVALKGTVVEMINGKPQALAGVTFRPIPDRSFADSLNLRQNIVSDEEGNFSGALAVGAAMTSGGTEPGRVYQTCRSQLRIVKDGYKEQLLWFDYAMPELNIILRRLE